ncbi:MFS transporter, partial [Streptomyces venezuelae]|uniref:MFS transporter n=1 Tax=Streptomyces venezuelae TaxID=54571 RepID=UPI00351B185E
MEVSAVPQLAPTGHPSAPPHDGRAPSRPAAALAVTAAATAVALMNYTAPMLTLPDTAAAFGTPPSAQAWLLNGTPLGLAVLLLVAGSLADAHGRRRTFLLGTLALGLTTALGALADSTLTFTAARVAQGAASAAVLAGSLGLLAHAYPAGRDRIRATGIWGASVSAGIALGPLLAGALSLADWRLVYGTLGAAALVIAGVGARALGPEGPSDEKGHGAGAGAPGAHEAGMDTPRARDDSPGAGAGAPGAREAGMGTPRVRDGSPGAWAGAPGAREGSRAPRRGTPGPGTGPRGRGPP